MGNAPTRLIVQSSEPFNAEPHPADLVASYLTPQSLFYIRSHGAVPALPADHSIAVDAPVPDTWSRDALAAAFATRSVVATLQCAGNRRADLQSVAPTNGNPWGVGAIGTARWTGVALIDLLRAAGMDDGFGGHVHFTAADVCVDEGELYGISIDAAKARDPDVLVAWAMNDEPLLPEHGAPLRLIVPGYAGVRSIKWLTQIALSDVPSPAAMQARDYKLFPPEVTSLDGIDWDSGLTIDTLPVNAAICVPADGADLPTGAVELRGYATAYGRDVARVDVSIDGGGNWTQACFEDGVQGETWRRWRYPATLPVGVHELVVRAVDSAGQGQPETPEQVWNVAGYLATHWHRITVRVA